MLRLYYVSTPAGAPDDPAYQTAEDVLLDGNKQTLLRLPKGDRLAHAPGAGLIAAVRAWMDGRRVGTPIVLMVHGYDFDPQIGQDLDPDSPFDSIYGAIPAVDHRMSWLPLVGETDEAGNPVADTAIAFAYQSTAGKVEVAQSGFTHSYRYAAFDLSPLAARGVAATLLALEQAGAADVRILAHSLGTRTTTRAIHLLNGAMPACLKRVVLLDGAEFCSDAAQAFAGCGFDVINISNRKDEVLKWGGAQAPEPFRAGLFACVIGRDGLPGNDRWLDLQLDRQDLAAWLQPGALAGLPGGIALQPGAPAGDPHGAAGMHHWVCYTGPGNRPLVRYLLLDAPDVAAMRAAGIPAGNDGVVYRAGTDFTKFPPPAVPMTFKARHDPEMGTQVMS